MIKAKKQWLFAHNNLFGCVHIIRYRKPTNFSIFHVLKDFASFLFRQMWKIKIWIELLSWLISVSSVCLWLTKSKNPHCLGTTTPPPTTATTMLNNLSVLYANWTLTNWCCTMLKIHYDIHLEVRGTSVLQLDPFTLKDPPAIQAIWSHIRVNVSVSITAAASMQQRLFFSSSFPP